MDLFGRRFEVCQEYTVIGQKVVRVATETYYGYDTLEQAYKTPSEAKKAIWDGWTDWFYGIPEAAKINIYVASRNSNIFTIGFMFKLSDKQYLGYITPSHNYLVVRG